MSRVRVRVVYQCFKSSCAMTSNIFQIARIFVDKHKNDFIDFLAQTSLKQAIKIFCGVNWYLFICFIWVISFAYSFMRFELSTGTRVVQIYNLILSSINKWKSRRNGKLFEGKKRMEKLFLKNFIHSFELDRFECQYNWKLISCNATCHFHTNW